MFSRFFIDHPRFALVISIVIVLLGVISLFKLPVAEYPEITPPQLYVSAIYTGASADVIMQTVALPLEDSINGVDDLLYFASTCGNDGDYNCTVTFKSGTDPNIAMVNLQNAVKRAEAKLPPEVTKAGITVEKRGNDILALFAFLTDGSSMDIMELDNYVDANIKNAITRLDGVSSADILSRKEYSMRIWLDPLRMAGLNLSSAGITSAIEAQNLQAAAGNIGTENSNPYVNYKLNVQGRLTTEKEFEEIVIRRDEDGSVICLKDVARVEIGKKSNSGRALFNGKEAIAMAIYRTPESNALDTVKRVKAKLDIWQSRFPAGVKYEIAYDPTEFILVTMKEIVLTIIIALLLVVLITWLFLQDWRATLIPSIAIPTSMLGTFPFMMAFGYSINVLTMFGLILVIGSLCDNAIVVVENTQSLMTREGLGPREATQKSMTQITGAMIATTLVTVACYVPLAFYGGMVGNIYIQFAVTMCISLCLSTVIALTLSPVLCAYLLKKPSEKSSLLFRPFNAVMDLCRNSYLFFVKMLVRQGILTLLLFALMLFAAWFLSGKIPSSFLPQEDKGNIMCSIELPNSASQARTDEAMEAFRKSIEDIEGIRSVLLISGMSMLSARAENVAMGFIQLENWEDRKSPETQLNMIISEIQKRTGHISAARIICMPPPAIMGLGVMGGATFELCTIGNADTVELSETAKKAAMELSADPAILFATSAFNADTPQIYLDVDRQKAEGLGLSANAIFRSLQSNFASLYVNDYSMKGQNYEVKIQASPQDRSSLNNIRTLQICNSNGEMVPLSSIATLRHVVGPNQIMRFNKMVCAEMNASAAPGVSSAELMQRIESFRLPENYHVEWTGMSYQERQNKGQIIYLMTLAMVFAYLFLVAQYESWSIPIPVMLTVGTAILGALLGLWFCGTKMGRVLGVSDTSTLSIYAQLGMVMLIGLTAKNAILMVEFSKQERESGKSIVEAAINGANLRYRAVLMTALSFLFGVLPLVVATGAGAGSRQAIGITTFSGLLLATLVGIIFTPALYAVFQRLREWVKRLFHKQDAS